MNERDETTAGQSKKKVFCDLMASVVRFTREKREMGKHTKIYACICK